MRRWPWFSRSEPIESEHHTTPITTYFLILANVAVFLVEQSQGEAFVRHWAFTPREFFASPFVHLPTVLTSMFLHGGWLHLIGNMAYLWTFGDNVEDNFGHLRFFAFYILAGIVAMFAQAAYVPSSTLPNLNGSGAIAGVWRDIRDVSARNGEALDQSRNCAAAGAIAIGGWIALQFVSAGSELAKTNPESVGGVAYMAHIGGFVAGIILCFVFRSRQTVNAAEQPVKTGWRGS